MITTPTGSFSDPPPPTNLGKAGPFRLEGIIAEGGAGIVYRGVQEVPLRRIAAVKVLRDGIASRHIRQRFDAERQALADMHHPNVESIFDAGTTDDGRPWFAMPFIDGSPITTHCDDEQLSLAERLTLFLEVCAGVAHAHAKGIIHRDLKPSNVLVQRAESVPIAKVIDFGIAKFREIDRATDMDMTVHGAFLGTLAYASPEQATLGAAHADARSDVFALGALLHELLCGLTHLPVDASRATMHDLSTFEPTRMSARIAAIARTDPERLERLAMRPSLTAAGLERSMRGDLDAIVMTALDPESSRRYGTVEALAEDIRRMLDGRPVEATTPTRLYLLSRFARRHRVETSAGVAIVLIVLSAIATLSWMLLRERTLIAALEHALCLSSLAAADGAFALGEPSGARAALLHAPESQRAFEWNYRMRLTDASQRANTNLVAGRYCVRHSPDGTLLATTYGDQIAVVDAESLELVRVLPYPTSEGPQPDSKRECWWVAWSPDGTRIAAGAVEGGVVLWEAATGTVVAERVRRHETSMGCFVDDATLVLGSSSGELSLVDAATLTARATARNALPGRVYAIIRAGGSRVVALSSTTLGAFDSTTLEPLWRVQTEGSAVGASIDPPSERIAVTYRAARPVTIHSAANGALIATITQSSNAWDACWSRTGDLLWTGGFDQRVLAFDGANYTMKRAFGGSTSQVWSISSADDSRAVSGDQSGALRWWSLLETPGIRRIALSANTLSSCTLSTSGDEAFIGDSRGALYCVNLATGSTRWERSPRQPIVASRMIAAKGVLIIEADGALSLLDPRDGSVIESTTPQSWCSHAVIAHDGSFIIVVRGAELECIELPSGRVRWSAALSDASCETLTISPDDLMIAAGTREHKPELFDCRDGAAHTLERVGAHSEVIWVFANDGQTIWSCTQESHCEAAAQDRMTGAGSQSFGGLTGAAVSLTLAQRAPRGAVRSRTGVIKIFEPGKDDDLLTLRTEEVKSRLFFTPDADRLLSLREDGVVEIFDGSPMVAK